MVYGEPQRLPVEFFVSAEGNWEADPELVVELRRKIRQVRPVTPAWHGGEARRSFMLQELSTATHVFVRRGAHGTPLQPPYQGLFKVLERHATFLKLDLGRRQDTVSVDGLKPAFLEELVSSAPAAPPRPPGETQGLYPWGLKVAGK